MRNLIMSLAICALSLTAQTKKIVVTVPDADILRELQTASPNVRIVPVTNRNAMQEIADADAFIGTITPEQVRAGKNLKWVGVMSAGVENVLFKSGGNDLRDSRIVLTNNKVVQGPEIADHAFAMLLSLARNLPAFWAAKQQERLQARPYPGIELNGRTAVVIGVGGIGMQIATRAWAFGMTVIGVDPEDKPFTPMVKRFVKPDQLDAVLPEADVVFISAPHTPLSDKMMGAKEFGLMKKGSYFIAVSRGGIYDLNGLVKALDEQKLAGAGVDVTDPEPLPPGHPLWKFPNTIITPHIAGRSDQDRARMIGTIKENIQRFADGRPLINVVDKQKGY
ncbi:MAG: D-2-hydroxyacid dehydrogenase [Acidobacteriota bacterium]|nr:D-2-hydroxyacid dehydrogenase [Acidobacteriota bacterium]